MSKHRAKISLIGGGNIGGTLAHLIALKDLGDVVIVDVNAGMAQGKALDISQSMGSAGNCTHLIGTDDYQLITGSDVIIVTAGIARKPNMSRSELLNINSKIIQSVAEQINKYASGALVIVITNPLDAMTWLMSQQLNCNRNKVIGMAGILDSIRFKYFLGQELNVSMDSISTLVLGGHGNTMVPLVRYSTVAGIPVMDLIDMGWITAEQIQKIIQRTRDGGGEIVSLLKSGSAYYAPAASAIAMAESYLRDQRKLFTCSAFITDYYGINTEGLYVGVPVIIGKNGVEQIVKLKLNDNEQSAFIQSVHEVYDLVDRVNQLINDS